jgi:hypothetical protein
VPNNLVVDVSSINDAINTINNLNNEAQSKKYMIMGQWATPLHIDASLQQMLIEAVVIDSNKFVSGWGTSTLSYDHEYVQAFRAGPVATAQIHGENLGVAKINVILYQEHVKGSERVLIHVNRLDGDKWVKNKESFAVHLIAIGY